MIQQFKEAHTGEHLLECMRNNESFNLSKPNLTFIGSSEGENLPEICKQQILSKVINGKPYFYNSKINAWTIWPGFEERQ